MSSILNCDKAIIATFNEINWKIQEYHSALSVKNKKGCSGFRESVVKRLDKENYSICQEILSELFLLRMDITLYEIELAFLDQEVADEVAFFKREIDEIGNLHASHTEAYFKRAAAVEQEARKIFFVKNPFLKQQTRPSGP